MTRGTKIMAGISDTAASTACPSAKSNLSLKGFRKLYGKTVAIENMDLEIREGKFTAIMGPSGCGKSTLLKCIAGLEDITGGDITRNGDRINDLPIWERDMPLVWQSHALFPFLSVIENVEFGLRMAKVPKAERKERCMKWLKRMSIEELADRGIAQLSGGQQQRVALARCLVTEPSILLLDEPLSSLDAHLSIRMQSELKWLQRELGITFVYVTHSHSEAFSMADQIVIMNKGRIEQTGSPQDIYLRPATPFVARFLGGSNILQCTITSTKKDSLVLKGDDGTFQCDPKLGQNLVEGADVALIVRADQVSLSAPERVSELNMLSCHLVGIEFVGAFVNMRLETSNGTPITVQQNQGDMAELDFEIGQSLSVYWNRECGHIIVE